MGKKGKKAKKLAADFKHGCEKHCEKSKQLIESCLGINKAEKGNPYVPATTKKKAYDIKPKPEPTVQEAVRHQERKPKTTVDLEIDHPGEERRRSYKETKTRSTSTQSLPTFGLQEINVNGVSGQAITRSSSASGTHLGDAHHAYDIKPKPEPTVQEAVRHQERKPKTTVDLEIDHPGEERRRSYKETKTRSTSTQSLPTFGLQEINVNGVSGQAITRSSSASGTHLGDAHHGDKIDIKQFIQKDPVETPRPLEIKGEQKTELCWCKWLKRGISLALLLMIKSTLVAFCFCLALAIAIVLCVAIVYAITEIDVIRSSLQWSLIAIIIIVILEAYVVYSFFCVVRDIFKSSNDA